MIAELRENSLGKKYGASHSQHMSNQIYCTSYGLEDCFVFQNLVNTKGAMGGKALPALFRKSKKKTLILRKKIP